MRADEGITLSKRQLLLGAEDVGPTGNEKEMPVTTYHHNQTVGILKILVAGKSVNDPHLMGFTHL